MAVSAKKTTTKTTSTSKKRTTKASTTRRTTSPKRRKKPGHRDALLAAGLAASLIVAAVLISAVLIQFRSPIQRIESLPVAVLPEPLFAATVEAAEKPEIVPQNTALSHSTAVPETPKPSPNTQTAKVQPPPAVASTKPATPPAAKPNTSKLPIQPKPAPEHKGTIVFVIDDAGNNLRELEPFLKYPGPLTIAVLPGLPYSAEAARRIRAAGKEVFLHQPMEALGGQYPGPQAIYSGMSAAEIREILMQNIIEVGPIAGMNNHQGSKITADKEAMETILAFCHEQKIPFLDSRTTAETVVPLTAEQLGMKIGERNVFVDNDQDKDSINRSIKSGLARAQTQGSTVMIGHTWSPELAPLLAELYPNLREQGYTFNIASAHIANAINIAGAKN